MVGNQPCFARHVGVNGSIAYVVDGNDELHLFFGQRILSSPDIHGMWHSIYKNDRWTEPTAIVKGPRVRDWKGLRVLILMRHMLLLVRGNDPAGMDHGSGERKDNGVLFIRIPPLMRLEAPLFHFQQSPYPISRI